jgi:transposase
MQSHQPKGILNIIADNARYYRSKLVADYLKNNPRINLIFLPSYSPKLNLIERLWRFYKKKILYDTYHQTFADFKNETLNFFENIKDYKSELSTLLKDNFYFPLAKFSQT